MSRASLNTYGKQVTSRDIAREAQVSQATVSRVLSGHPQVAASIRARVLAAAARVDYRPNGMARAMRTNRTGNIGVVVSRLANPLYPELRQLIGQQLTKAGLRMVVWNTDETDEGAAAAAVRAARSSPITSSGPAASASG